ncbi:MAG TPA: DUF1549 domain-containing protein [Planctomycetaceae bacterium]|jgi:hypothetical protein|nr:DUF1549 domain-containing protein [Planctomycetaceae bacterium]
MSAGSLNPSGEHPAGDRTAELRQILEALFEERADAAQLSRLDELVVGDSACRRFYLEYVDLHGNLYWDAAQANTTLANTTQGSTSQGDIEPVPLATPVPERRADTRPASLGALVDSSPLPDRRSVAARRVQPGWIWAALAVAATVVVAGLANWPTQPVPGPVPDVERDLTIAGNGPQPRENSPAPADERVQKPVEVQPPPNREKSTEPSVAAVSPANSQSAQESLPERKSPPSSLPVAASVKPADVTARPESAAEPEPKDVVAFIDARLKKTWKTAGVKPSPVAADEEWLRRVYLDIAGHIPPEAAVDAFLRDESSGKRSRVVSQLLKEPDYARNWATIWANLLVGRQPRAAGVSREMLEKFLRDSFSTDVPWNEVVYELVSAEGTPEQNPATNFLLAHLNNDAVPATAMTARLLLGIQVQCTQCHDHPFQNDKQGHFWELKSFFQQTEMASNASSGAMGSAERPNSMSALPELVTRKVGGPLYYETRRGEMRVAYPIYAGHKIDPGPSVNRRRELARLIAKGDDRQVALAFVNRTWQHFFGYGFTRPVDDMGPHNPPSNPEILERLADEFIASGYDLKQLCRWICSTDAYQRTSALRSENRSDEPATGAPPTFSHVYLKPMTAEELYESLLVATQAKSSARTDWNDAGRRRQDWVRQFVINYGTDENDEATVPAGSVSQALVMMNDSIVRSALAVEPGTFLDDVVHARVSDVTKIRRLCRSALSRDPKPAELDAALEQLRAASKEAGSDKARQLAQAEALQDIFWAFLNANEFAFVH